VPEPRVLRTEDEPPNVLTGGFGRLTHTFRKMASYRQLLLFLIAFWVYNNGIGTIMTMAVAYGDEIGLRLEHMVIALIITQFVGIPFSFAFGWLAKRIGAKRGILLAIVIYTIISVAGYFMQTETHFYILAFAVGLVQGGSQALSRSVYGNMVPKSQSAEFFGFYSTSSKIAGVLGPLLFGVVSQITGGSRLSILSLIVFFLVGGLLLIRVDVREGIRVAREEDVEVGWTTG